MRGTSNAAAAAVVAGVVAAVGLIVYDGLDEETPTRDAFRAWVLAHPAEVGLGVALGAFVVGLLVAAVVSLEKQEPTP